MQLAILGGTGDIGEGLALRWGRDTDHTIVIGSRDADRAEAAASRYVKQLAARGYESDLTGTDNATAVTDADVVVASVPPYSVADAVEAVGDALPTGSIVVSPAVGMRSDEAGMHYHRPSAGSVTALVDAAAPPDVAVVGAFHSVPAGRLRDLDDPLDLDTIVAGDDPSARDQITALAASIDGLRAWDGGPLANAAELEAMTPLLINLGRYNDDLHDAGFRVATE